MSFEIINENGDPAFIFICDHASNALPADYGTLGLEPARLERHIGWDIGAGDVVRKLAEHFDAPAILGVYSRLLIDLNRGLDDPTLVMKMSDGDIIPGNAQAGETEVARRVEAFHKPYHAKISQEIDRALAQGLVPIIVSIHSFTPAWKRNERPWHVGILWDRDGRVPKPLLEVFDRQPDCVVGDNLPYTGELENDCLYTHGTRRGIPHALLEIRQDLIDHEAGVHDWSERIARALEEVCADPEIREIKHFGSHIDE